MKYDGEFPFPCSVRDSQRNEEGETPSCCVRNGRKGDGGSPSRSRSKQKCDKEGFPVKFKTENATRMGLPLPVVSEMKENATRRGTSPCRVQNGKRDEEGIPPPRRVRNKRKCDEEGFPPSHHVRNIRQRDEERFPLSSSCSKWKM